MYLGCVHGSNESYVGAFNGDVIKARGLVRVVESARWNSEAVGRIVGTPAKRNPSGNTDYERVEESEQPNSNLDDSHDPGLERLEDPQVLDNVAKRVRITRADLRKYGYSEGCPRCADLQAGRNRTNSHHSEGCRVRIYGEYEAKDPIKWRAVNRQMEKDSEVPDDNRVDVDLEGQHCEDRPLLEEPADAERRDFDDLNYEPNEHSDGEANDMDDNGEDGTEPVDWDQFPDLFSENEFDDSNMVDALIGAGVDTNTSKMYAATLTGKMSGVTLIEAYGRGSIVTEANQGRRNLNIRGLGALDLRTTKEDGSPWDFNKKKDRHLALKMIEEQEPDWIIGSPPCTAFCAWNVHMNFPKMSPEVVKQKIAEGERHLKFCAKLYRHQHARGKFFLHEHPAGARSWHHPSILAVLRLPGVGVVKGDQCMFGLMTKGDTAAERRLAKKPTKFMSNSPHMLKQLEVKCDRSHHSW